MIDPIEFKIETETGPRLITISPVNLTLGNGILYATGEYKLDEGNVGIGTITFKNAKSWDYDGFGDISKSDLAAIADFIRERDFTGKKAAAQSQPKKEEEEARYNSPADPSSSVINFLVYRDGAPVDVHVQMHYPTYDISLSGKPTAQLQQDHHSNWYVATGHLEDKLVQEIGRRITKAVMGD
ncbi:hypothetical protein C8P68_10553 [Mucilaginibacter yixingensis]|uniref:Uncharacterized protein n=1 Tax=Mucilaginibacter yixingensis TaxID=1295612 RepID=A0A2T5J7V6_9SPHI|nr:hypothetical protein [Mucilaginibacter yixingensis]PTQ95548.1 hypothetical protein C8P68_10553 [Mucilaginibacter yixingensis]